MPSSVRDSVLARVSRLSTDSQQALRILSVIPRRISVADMFALTGSSFHELSECERFGLLEVEGEVVFFRHELIRRAIEASLTISEGVAIHRALLQVIPHDADPAWLVYHARGAIDIDRLMVLGPLAADAAKAISSNREAAAHLRALAPYLDRFELNRRADILNDWALAEHYLENVEAIDILDKAIEAYREVGSDYSLARALVSGVDIDRTFGRFAAAKSHASEAIEILERHEPGAELAAALAAHAWFLIHGGQIAQAEAETERAIVTAEAAAAESALISALGVKGIVRYVRGQPGGLDLLEDLRKRAKLKGRHYQEVSALLQMPEAGPVPHLPETGKVVSFSPNSSTASEVASGGRLLVDVEFGRGGSLFALSQGVWVSGPAGSPASPNTGSLVEVNDDGTFAVVVDELNLPTSLEVIRNTAYVVTLGGEIWTIDNVSAPPHG